MYDYVYNVYESIIDRTNSELILFFIIVAIVVLPLYLAIIKGRKADKIHELKRDEQAREWQKQIIEVVKENSTVIAGLKITLENSNSDSKATLERIHTRIDKIAVEIAIINNKIDKNKG